jgi:hypothetical protein
MGKHTGRGVNSGGFYNPNNLSSFIEVNKIVNPSERRATGPESPFVRISQ